MSWDSALTESRYQPNQQFNRHSPESIGAIFMLIRQTGGERVETTVKAVSAVIGGSISWMVGGFGLAFVVLLGLMAIDFITGLMAGSMVEGLKSSVGKKGLIKKTYIILLIGAVYMIQSLIPALSSAGYAADGIAIAYCVIEFLSIIENGGKLGVPIGPLKNIIAILKQEEGNK